jgi:Raf kinase inhibitor-like YbhB/YbcL family protein
MNISSPQFLNNKPIPAKYTCDGENTSPPLVFSDVPENAKSLVLIMDDPDAPMGTWIHWVLWNIDPKIKEIPENSMPSGAVQGKTSRQNSYGGPCPPNGIHRYFFKLFALDTTLDISSQTDANSLIKIINKNIIAKTELIGLYQRN